MSLDCTNSSSNRYKILVKLAIKRKQLSDQVSELTTNRLSVYLRCLNILEYEGPITAGRLAELSGLTTAAVTGMQGAKVAALAKLVAEAKPKH